MHKKIAIVHDICVEFGGAERVLLALMKVFPDATIFTSILKDPCRSILEENRGGHRFLFSKFLTSIPLSSRALSFLKPLVLIYWKTLDLSPFDVVISSSHSYSAKSIHTPKSVLHISYIHAPPRYLYHSYNQMSWTRQWPWRAILSPLMKLLQIQDIRDAQGPNLLVANSKNIAKQIRQIYQRNSLVVYPPFLEAKITERMSKKTSLFVQNLPKNEYFLSVARLVNQKGVELAVRTCTQYHIPLVVVGSGPQEELLKKLAGPTVQFLGFVPDNVLGSLYLNARALIHCAIDEDFGMAPLEALSQGRPVIGYNSGGIKETIVSGKTGILFDEYTIESLHTAIKAFGHITFSAQNCKSAAAAFSRESFAVTMTTIVNWILTKRHE